MFARSPNIHPTAIVAKGAKLHSTVEIGPFCTIGPHVTLGEGTRLVSHVAVEGHTTIGAGNTIYPFASIGQPSPDRKYKGEPTTLVIGNDNDIREYVTIHIGTAADRGETTIGHRNLFMAGSHVAHDCVVGNDCILANYVQLAGHVVLEDHVVVGGLSGIHQRVRVGAYAIIGGHSAVDYDVPPYASVMGRRAHLKGLNLVGLRRHGFDRTLIQSLDKAFDTLFHADTAKKPLKPRAEKIAKSAKTEELKHLATFILNSQRGLTMFDEGKE
jgi:UDP-N-acetylglucosamine acyltransferase